jgi:HYR domain
MPALLKLRLAIGLALAAGGTVVPLAAGGSAGTLPLRAAVPWTSTGSECEGGTTPGLACYPHPGGPVAVPGLGFVSQSLLYPVEVQTGSDCPNGVHVLAYPARLIVRGKGEITLAVDAAEDCLLGPPIDTVLRPTQSFTVTGGSGAYAGASGSGAVRRTRTRRNAFGNGEGIDHWEGTLVVPNLEFDTTAPTIKGAAGKSIRAPRKATGARVRYRLSATDNVDGAVPVTCEPRSGTRFKVGRTVVRCSAMDTSANTTRASFTVTVKRRR